MNFPFSRLNFSLPSLSLFLHADCSPLGSFFSLPTLFFYYPFSPSIFTISPSRLPFSESHHGGSRLFSLSLSLSLSSPFLPSPSPLYSSIVRDALAPSCLSIYPSLSSPSAGLPFASFSASLFLSRFLSLLRIYRGEQRMWMGWVSPRLGERSITCEPKGEEIRGCAAYLQERNGAEHKPEWWNTAEHARTVCPTPRYPSRCPEHSSRGRLSSFLLFHPSPLPRFPAIPAPYVRNEPRVIHHNRFTCTSAVRTFTALVSAAPVLPAQTAPFS